MERLRQRRLRKARSGGDGVGERLEHIAEVSRNARATWFALIALLLFCSVTLMGVRDRDFFEYGASTQLPLVGVTVPTKTFFWAAPILVTGLFTYLHLYLEKLWRGLALLPPKVGGRDLDECVYPWLVADAAIQLRKDTPKRLFRWVKLAVTLFLVWLSGPVVMAIFWIRSWPPHDEWLTTLIGVQLVIVVVVAAVSHRRMALLMRRCHENPSGEIGVSWIRRIFSIVLTELFAIAVFFAGWAATEGGPLMSVVGIEEDQDRFLYRAQLYRAQIAEKPEDWMPREIALREYRRRVRSEHDHEGGLKAPGVWSAFLPQAKSEDESGVAENDPTNIYGETHRSRDDEFEEIRKIAAAGLRAGDWRRADLRGADLREAFLVGIDMSGFDLTSLTRDERRSLAREERLSNDLCPLLEQRGIGGARLSGGDLRGAKLEGANLICARAEKANFASARLEAANLNWARLEGANLEGARLDGANLTRARLKGADLEGARLKRAKLGWARLEVANLEDAQLEGADLRMAQLEGANIREAQLKDANLPLARLEGADLRGARLAGANLHAARLEEAILEGADLEGADLTGARLEGASLGWARLDGAFLGGARLEGAYLGGARLEGAILEEASLERTELHDARLKGADLRQAQLEGADLEGANLEGADLRGAEMTDTVLQYASVIRARLSQVRGLTQEQLAEMYGVWDSDNPVTVLEQDAEGEWTVEKTLEKPAHWPTEPIPEGERYARWRAWALSAGAPEVLFPEEERQ